MRMIKFWALFYLVYGIIELMVSSFVDFEERAKHLVSEHGQEVLNQIMPAWKHWFLALSSIIGAITMLYYVKKIKIETEKSSPLVKLFKEGLLYSFFLIGLGAQMCILEYDGDSAGMKILCSVLVVIGIAWNYGCISILRRCKDENEIIK